MIGCFLVNGEFFRILGYYGVFFGSFFVCMFLLGYYGVFLGTEVFCLCWPLILGLSEVSETATQQ